MGQNNYKVGLLKNYKVGQKNYKVGQVVQIGAKKSQSEAGITKWGKITKWGITSVHSLKDTVFILTGNLAVPNCSNNVFSSSIIIF